MSSNGKGDDSIIKSTADEALSSKLSATSKGYYSDPYLSYFAVDAGSSNRSSKYNTVHPIIRKGSHARVCCMDRVIAALHSNQFENTVKNKEHVQVVVLGAGKDTSYFRYRSNTLTTQIKSSNDSANEQSVRNVSWYEVDHFSIINFKKSRERMIESDRMLQKRHPSADHVNILRHYLIEFDLRSSAVDLMKLLEERYEFKRELPTLFVMECVQMYLPELSSHSLLRTLADACRDSVIAIYDPILLHDPFGKVMQRNLARLCNEESSLLQNKTLKDCMTKLKCCGFQRILACDMKSAYGMVVTADQRLQSNRCEMLDEYEEWNLIMRHYAFIVAGTGGGISDVFCSARGESSPLGLEEGQCLTEEHLDTTLI
mmetsp:Transcript_2962/g.4249  ORF Transcript_2962/g.4249 Transcript_2962/m.4249 type:complete len:372 (-) Transcript_2962:34-1149(-)